MGNAASYQKQVDETMRELLAKGGPVNPSARDEFLAACQDTYTKLISGKSQEFIFRASKIGQPVCQQQFEKLGKEKEYEEVTPLMKFQFGNLVEALTIVILRHAGINIEEVHTPISLDLEGVTIPGTLDIVIDGRVWDVKSAAPWAFENKFSTFQTVVNDDPFGYAVQLYLYAEARGLKAGGWIVVDKVSGLIKFIEVPRIDTLYKHNALQTARTNIAILKNTTSEADLVRCFPLVEEVADKRKTGRVRLGSTCGWCKFKQQCWDNKLQYLPTAASEKKTKKSYGWYYID